MSNCRHSLKVWAFENYRELLVWLRGMPASDKAHLAEISIVNSIEEIKAVETNAKQDLQKLVLQVKQLDPVKQRAALHEVLSRSKQLRNTLSTTNKKRLGMEQHLETLRQSQLNQSIMQSMKNTTDALQTLGLKVTDADDIMMDLEDSTHDMNSMQGALSQSFAVADFSADDLEEELNLMLSDDALCAAIPAAKPPAPAVSQVKPNTSVQAAAAEPYGAPELTAQVDAQEELKDSKDPKDPHEPPSAPTIEAEVQLVEAAAR
jgi:hypothetical protein